MKNLKNSDIDKVIRGGAWAGGIVIGALLTLLVTELYSRWQSSSDLRDLEDRVNKEIVENLDILDKKLWGLEALGEYEGATTKVGDATKFKMITSLPYSRDVYDENKPSLYKIKKAEQIKLFYGWLEDSANLQKNFSGQIEVSEFDSLLDPKRNFLGKIYSIQRQGIYLYIFGCDLAASLIDCSSRLDRIQSEFRALKKTDQPIKSMPVSKLEEFLNGWSVQINALIIQ